MIPRLALAFFVTTGLALSVHADTQDCSWTKEIERAQMQAQEAASPIERMNLYANSDLLKQKAALGLFKTYLEGRLQEKLAPPCLAKLGEPYGFLTQVQSAFLNQSLRIFKTSKSARIQRLLELLGPRASESGNLIFRLAGDQFAPPPTELKAGFHRGSGSIFMDVTRIHASEWLVILAHELLHDVDMMIPAAVRKYSDVQIAIRLIERAKSTSLPSDLSDDERRMFKDWIQAGMDRGLLAEARAWTITILVYQDGLNEGLWGRIAWLDAVMSERRPNEPWERFSLRFLAARSAQPRESVFAHALSRNLLDEVKSELLNGLRPLEFGSLAPFLDQ
jgi:hypothetical protein